MSAFLLGNRIVLQRAYAAVFFLLLAVSVNAWRQDLPIVEHVLSLSGWVLVAVGSMGRIWAGLYVSGQKTTFQRAPALLGRFWKVLGEVEAAGFAVYRTSGREDSPKGLAVAEWLPPDHRLVILSSRDQRAIWSFCRGYKDTVQPSMELP